MTFALLRRVTVLGELTAGQSAVAGQPMIDPTGRPVAEPDDGPQTAPAGLQAMSSGFLQSPDDPGRSEFNSTGFKVLLTRTDSRMMLVAQSAAAGQWAGQVRYRWVTDVLVRPRTGRRDAGGIRILFLDPSSAQPGAERHFVDLVTDRGLAPDTLAWDLVQRILVDRRRWTPPDAQERLMIETVLQQGQRPTGEPGWYSIPISAVMPAAEPTVSAELTVPVEQVTLGRIPAVEGPEVLPLVPLPPPGPSPWSPAADLAAAPAIPLPTAAGMIMSVPGVGRVAVTGDMGPRTSLPGAADNGRYRIECDSGDVVVIDSPTLFGRDPSAEPGEDARLHVLADDSFSYSKTHLLLTPGRDGIAATDRHSTNGVLIEQLGGIVVCPPGVAQLLVLPATLRCGSRWMTVAASLPD